MFSEKKNVPLGSGVAYIVTTYHKMFHVPFLSNRMQYAFEQQSIKLRLEMCMTVTPETSYSLQKVRDVRAMNF